LIIFYKHYKAIYLSALSYQSQHITVQLHNNHLGNIPKANHMNVVYKRITINSEHHVGFVYTSVPSISCLLQLQ